MAIPSRASRALIVLASALALAACSASGEIPHATQPNGPPKPPAPKPEPADSPKNRQAAIDKALAFAKTKYGDKLDYALPDAQYNDPATYGARAGSVKNLAPPGTWKVSLKLAKKPRGSTEQPNGQDAVTAANDAQMQVIARSFIVASDGSVKEGEPDRVSAMMLGARRGPPADFPPGPVGPHEPSAEGEGPEIQAHP